MSSCLELLRELTIVAVKVVALTVVAVRVEMNYPSSTRRIIVEMNARANGLN